MLRRKLLGAAVALALAPLAALAQGEEATAPAGPPVLQIEVAGQANGTIDVLLRPDLAPQHVQRIIDLANAGAYDGVVFHRVIDGFMAQTGDVRYGRRGGDLSRAGTGDSDLPDLDAEFSAEPFVRGVMGMARARSPNSANSQFFLMFEPAPHLNGQYTVLGQMIDGFDVLDAIRRGQGQGGAVLGTPDYMVHARVLVPGDDGYPAEAVAAQSAPADALPAATE